LDITPIRAGGQTFQRVDPWSSDAVGEVRPRPVPLSTVTKEGSERGGDIVHGDAAPAVCTAMSQVGIDIADLHVCEIAPKSAVPLQKMPDLTGKLFERGLAQAALLFRPTTVLSKSELKRNRLCRRVKMTQESEP
jgi:hypothetical protein